MNKRIIGISVAMLFAANGALAQSNVTVYGILDAGIAYNQGTNIQGNTVSLESGQQSYSRIGFKGKEDLGKGMSALFVLEQGVQINKGISGYQTIGSGIANTIDDFPLGNDGVFSSQAYVGLSSKDAGTVTAGRQFSPLYESYLAIDPFMNGFAANMNNFFGSADGFSPFQRMSNAVIYKTPDNANLYGFKGSLAYGFGEQAGSISTSSQVGASLGYANGALTVAYAYHHANLGFVGSPELSYNTHFIGATYDIAGIAKLHGAFDQKKSGNIYKAQDYMIGVTVPFGASSVFADFTYSKDKLDAESNAKQFAIGYTYNLSKRTNFYTAYTYVKNDQDSFINFVDPSEQNGESTVKSLQVGVRHMF